MSNATCSLEICFISERDIKKEISTLPTCWILEFCEMFSKTAPTNPLNNSIAQDLCSPYANHGESAVFPTAKRQCWILLDQVKWLWVIQLHYMYFREAWGFIVIFKRKINSGDRLEDRFLLVMHLTVFLYSFLLDCSLEQEIKRPLFYHVLPSL